MYCVRCRHIHTENGCSVCGEACVHDPSTESPEVQRAYQEGFSAGWDRCLQTVPQPKLVETVEVLKQRNTQLHADKHELRTRRCHQCGAFPEIP